MRRFLPILLILALTGCLRNEVSDPARVMDGAARLKITLTPPEDVSVPLQDVTIKIQNKERPFSYTAHPDAAGVAELNLQAGKYDVLASRLFADLGVSVTGSMPDFLLSSEGIIAEDGSVAAPELSIALNAFTPGLRSALNRGKHH